MAKIIFDVDSSLASIGTKDEVVTMCGGFPPIPVTDGLQQVLDIIRDLFVTKVTVTKHPLIAANIQERIMEPSPLAKQHNVQAIIVDTISHLQRNDLRLLEEKRPNKQMEIQDWGVIERMYNLGFGIFKRLPIPVVVNSHTAMDKDNVGNFFLNAALKGKAGDFINEYFDLVLYTHVSKSKDGKRVFSWLTKPDGMRKGKDRLNLLPDSVPQDFAPIFQKYAEAGYPNPKILVIGESGTGKTKALSTIP